MTHAQQSDPAAAYSDRAFLSGMIVHHQAAVAMAKTTLETGTNKTVKAWAAAVNKSQTDEIKAMEAMLKDLGGVDEQAAQVMQADMDKMTAMPGSGDPDKDFVAMMVGHHAGALEMAIPALLHSDNPKIAALAEGIIKEQADEILQFRKWLKEI